MIAARPADINPPPQPTGISKFERLFRTAAGLDIDKSDIKRHEEFIHAKLYDLLVVGEATAKVNGRDAIETFDLPITRGLESSIDAFLAIEEDVALAPILDRLAARPPLDLPLSEETDQWLPRIVGGLSVALARSIKIIDADVKNPQSAHWERAKQIFDLLL
jgi:hypothetical protein